MAIWQWQVEMIGIINLHGQRSRRVVEPNEMNDFAASVEAKQLCDELVLHIRELPLDSCVRRIHQDGVLSRGRDHTSVVDSRLMNGDSLVSDKFFAGKSVT